MLLSQQLCCFSEGDMAWPTYCHRLPGDVFWDRGDFHFDRRLKKIAVEQLIGIASCVIWKWLLKHKREERNWKWWDLNSVQRSKPPNNFCHFCFFFSKDLGGICFIFLNFSWEPPRWETSSLWNRLFCGQWYQCVPGWGSNPGWAPQWPCSTQELSLGHQSGIPGSWLWGGIPDFLEWHCWNARR